MKNNNEKEILNDELAREELLLQEYIDERNKLIIEEREIIINRSLDDSESYISLSKYNQLSDKRKEEFASKNDEIHNLDNKIKASTVKIGSYELKLGKKKVKDVKKDYLALCERIICEDKVRKSWFLGAYLKDYDLLRSNRMMLINKVNFLTQFDSFNENLLKVLRIELNDINSQIVSLEMNRQEILKNINVLSIGRNSLLDRGKRLIKKDIR